MPYLTVDAVQAWLEPTKLSIGEVESELETHISSTVLGAVARVYDTSTWVDSASTPQLLLTIMSMKYAAAFYARAYSEDPGDSSYAEQLDNDADTLLSGVTGKEFHLVGEDESSDLQPAFFPTDASSAKSPTSDNPQWGPAAFTMGKVF